MRTMKASGSPCHLDKISIIPFKRCPYLRTYKREVLSIIWKSGEIPDDRNWRAQSSFTRKSDASDP